MYGKYLEYLDRQTVDCGENEALVSFRLVSTGCSSYDRRYEFVCAAITQGGASGPTCTCDNPQAGNEAEKNGYTCTDGSSSYCTSTEECYATTATPKNDAAKRCRTPKPRLTAYPRGRLEVMNDGKWRPVCGHWFWDNDNGATKACQELGYTAATIHKMSGETFTDGAVYVGKCNSGEIPGACNGGCCCADCTYEKDSGGTVTGSYKTGTSVTMAQCKEKCLDGTWSGCKAFSRYMSSGNDDKAKCWWTDKSNKIDREDSNEDLYIKTGCKKNSFACGDCGKGSNAVMEVECTGETFASVE